MGASSKTSISPRELIELIGTADCPAILDVRRRTVFEAAADMIPTARWRDHRTPFDSDSPDRKTGPVVVYCAHGHQLSQSAAALMRSAGIDARSLDGGIEAYRAAGGPSIRKDNPGRPAGGGPSRWITRERPKIDRIACPWFVRRFVDRDAEFYFVAAEWVRDSASELGAVPFDIPDAEFSHVGELCSFDAFLSRFGIEDPALRRLAVIVRGADTGRPDLAPQADGLLAMSLGLSAICQSDQAMLEQGMILYDTLYAWCRFATAETHGWPPASRPVETQLPV